jgi:RNA polymerase sigma-32 factor
MSAVAVIPQFRNLDHYITMIKTFPMLTREEEYRYAMSFREKRDSESARRLISSHLILVVKIARKFSKRFKGSMEELVSEGNLGLVTALNTFNPDRGFRFSTYAMTVVDHAIREFMVRAWSMVRMSNTHSNRKLFFRLHAEKAKLGITGNDHISPENLAKLAITFDLPERDIILMHERFLQGTVGSLNLPVSDLFDGSMERIDLVEDESDSPEEIAVHNLTLETRRIALQTALTKLSPRERIIFEQRYLKDDAVEYRDIGKEMGISGERVRQLCVRAYKKVQADIIAYMSINDRKLLT